MRNETMFAVLITMTGVLLGIYAAEGGVRLDWPETALVAGVVLITVGIIKFIAGGTKNEQGND